MIVNSKKTTMPQVVRAAQKKPMAGLGDAVAAIAQPIAKIIDRASGGRTNVQGCSACKKRQEFLNNAVPFNK